MSINRHYSLKTNTTLCLPWPITDKLQLFLSKIHLKVEASLHSSSHHCLQSGRDCPLTVSYQKGTEALQLLVCRGKAGALVHESLGCCKGMAIPARDPTGKVVDEAFKLSVRNRTIDPCSGLAYWFLDVAAVGHATHSDHCPESVTYIRREQPCQRRRRRPRAQSQVLCSGQQDGTKTRFRHHLGWRLQHQTLLVKYISQKN